MEKRIPRGLWKRALQQIIDDHNGQHASRPKVVGHATRAARAAALFRMFHLLRALGFEPWPHDLRGRHVQALMAYWTADPDLVRDLAARGTSATMPARPYSAAYIQQQLSILRVFASWIGKPGLVLPATAYVHDSLLVTRNGVAERDRSWDGNGVDAQAVIDRVTARDAVVGLQLEVMLAFGLRRKEAVMFTPSLAEVPASALPAAAGATRYLAFVRVKRGTKGGRVRYTAIRNAVQEQALARAQAAAPRPGQHIGQPGLSLKQALTRFDNVLRRCGVTRNVLGVTAHGLRHQFAADLYVELAALPPPVRGGAVPHPDAVRAVYLEVARQLGHGRTRISGAYLGGRRAS